MEQDGNNNNDILLLTDAAGFTIPYIPRSHLAEMDELTTPRRARTFDGTTNEHERDVMMGSDVMIGNDVMLHEYAQISCSVDDTFASKQTTTTSIDDDVKMTSRDVVGRQRDGCSMLEDLQILKGRANSCEMLEDLQILKGR